MADKMPRYKRSVFSHRAKAIIDMVVPTSKQNSEKKNDATTVQEKINQLYARPYSMTSSVFDKFCETQTTINSYHFQDLAKHINKLKQEAFPSNTMNTTCKSPSSQSTTPALDIKDLTCYEEMPPVSEDNVRSIVEEQQRRELNNVLSPAIHNDNEQNTENVMPESPLPSPQIAPDFESDDSVRDKDYIPSDSSDNSDDDFPAASPRRKVLVKNTLQASTLAGPTPRQLLQSDLHNKEASKNGHSTVDFSEWVDLENVDRQGHTSSTVDAIQESTMTNYDCIPSKNQSTHSAPFDFDSNETVCDKDYTSNSIHNYDDDLTATTSSQNALINKNLQASTSTRPSPLQLLQSDHPTEKALTKKRRNTVDFPEIRRAEVENVTRKRRNTIDTIQESGEKSSDCIPSKKRKLYDTSLTQRKDEKKQMKMMEYRVKPGCTEKCSKKCYTYIKEEQREKLNQEYWSLNWGERRLYVRQRISTAIPKRKYTNEPKRKPKRSFTLKTSDGNAREVCKVFFLTTLGFKPNNDKILRLDADTNDTDLRGKHVKTPAYDRQLLTEHVQSFHPYEPHHRREHAPLRRYLPSDISITHMHKDYCEKNSNVAVSYELYRKHLKTMNISFTRLGNEECETCEAYHLHSKQTSHDANAQLEAGCRICIQYDLHHKKYTKARQLYNSHRNLPQNENQIFFSADLEKVIMLPRMDTFKSVIFCQRLIAFNQTFAPVGKITSSNKPVTVIWHDAIAGRKQEDIMSAYYAFLIRNRDIGNVNIWLDNCSAQNKNWLLFSMLVHMVNSDLISTNNITLNYFEPGHTFMSSDQVHHQVELAMKKKGKLYDFQDFVDAVSSINNSKVIVQSLSPENFINIPNMISDRRIQKSNPRAYLSNMVQVAFKRNDFDLYYKNDFDDEFTGLRFMNDKYLKSPRIMNITFRSSPKGIGTSRKSAIIDKLTAIIPPHKMTFWRNLPTSNVNETDTNNDIRGRHTI